MNKSIQEEMVAALWTIAALLAFNGGYDIFGWVFTAKAVIDVACSIYCALNRVRATKARQA